MISPARVNKEKNKPERKTWEYPWKYKESFLVVLELVFLGLILEVLSGGRGAPLLRWPANLIACAALLGILLMLHSGFRSHPLVKWLSSVPAAISAISFFALAVLLLGFIPQGAAGANRYLDLLGLTSMKNSWLMMVAGLYFLVSLGLVALRRTNPFSRKNLGFLLNHAGLWITIAAGYLGAGDLVRLNLTLTEAHGGRELAVDRGVDQRTQEAHSLPFAVRLVDFDIEQYDPKLALVDGRTGQLILEEGKAMPFVGEGLKVSMLDWEIEVLAYEPEAFRVGDQYVPGDSMGNAPAAFVRALRPAAGQALEGWISSGSFRVMQQPLQLDGHTFLVMTLPEPERYSSEIVIEDGDAELPLTLEVNKPFQYRGWKLYQLSYDQRMGKWSRISVIEAVRDPWLPAVYTGIFLLLAGALYLFWVGRDIKDENELKKDA